jgi:hypothetical protein
LVLGGLVLWLANLVIRLRMEALINRRVIASLHKKRTSETKERIGNPALEILRLLLLGIIALAALLMLSQVMT